MELKIKKHDFINLLKWSQSIVEKRGTMPILSNLLLEATQSGLRVLATDLETTLVAQGSAEVKKEGKAVINARNLFEIVREAPEEVIGLMSKGEKGIEISSGKARFRIVGMNPEEFPTWTQLTTKDRLKIDVREFEEMIGKTFYAASTDETRYTLNGLYMVTQTRGEKTFLRVVATDGHRLSYTEKEAGQKWNLPKGLIIPRKGINGVKNLVAGGEGDIEVAFEEKAVLFQRDKVSLTVRLIEGEFPAYEQVVPKKSDRIVSVSREVLMGALRRAAIMTSEQGPGVKFSFSPALLEIGSSNPDLGEANEEIAVDYKGTAFQVGFNPKYFLDVLNILEDEKIVLELKDEVSPCVIRSEFDRGFLSLVMPMRI